MTLHGCDILTIDTNGSLMCMFLRISSILVEKSEEREREREQ